MIRQKSSQDVIKDRYKDSITCFLKDNSLYDCLAHNNQVTIIDQSFSCWDVVQIFSQQCLDEVIFWNSDLSSYDGMFTHTDIIKVILRFYKNVIDNSGLSPGIEEEVNIEEEGQQGKELIPLYYKLSQQQRDKLICDLQHVSIKQWFQHFEADNTTALIKGKMDERLHEACRKLITSNVHRIIVIDNDSRMIAGTIQQRDILVFLIKGFTQYFNDTIATFKERENSEQHKLEIGYFYTEKRPVYCLKDTMSVFQSFHDLIFLSKRTSTPIVNNEGRYLGTLHRRDFLFIVKDNNFDLLSQTLGEFLEYLKREKHKYNIYQLLTKEFFTMNQTVKEVVENLVLSESCFLVCLNDNKTVNEQLSIQDIFNFFLNDE